MRKLLNLKYTAWSFILLGISLLQSCSDDETYDVVGSAENKVFINTQSWSPINTPKNGFLFNVTNTPVGSMIADADKIEVKFAVQCTHKASSDIHVKFELDNALITEGYAALPDGVTLTMDKTALTIPEGATMSSDSITISVSNDDLDLLTVGQYMAPVKIVSVTNAKVSDNLTSAYLLVKTTYTNCVDHATSVPGTAAARTGWKATVNGADQAKKLFDNSKNTYFYGSNFTLEVDLAAVHENITGLVMGYYSQSYSMGSADIYTSDTDTDHYELQGSPTFPRSTPQYVQFYKSVRARFVKIVVTSGTSTSGVAISEFNVFQE